MARLNQERQAELEPQRRLYAIATLIKVGYEVTSVNNTELNFEHNGHIIKFFPYSGWCSGKGIGSGRGFKKLMESLLNK